MRNPIATPSHAILRIVELSFDPHDPWFFSDGQRSFHAFIFDQDFLSKIDQRHLTFSRGDQLEVALEPNDNINTATQVPYNIVIVFKHISPPPSE